MCKREGNMKFLFYEKFQIVGKHSSKLSLIGAGIHMIILMSCSHVTFLLLPFAFVFLSEQNVVYRWWHYGTEHQKFFWVQGSILPLLMCGRLVAFSPKWWIRNPYFLVILRLMNSSRFSGLSLINLMWSCFKLFHASEETANLGCQIFYFHAELWALLMKKPGQVFLRYLTTNQLSPSGRPW